MTVRRLEKEYVFIVLLKNLSQLRRAYKKVKIEQWQLKSKSRQQQNSGSIRARTIDNKEFILTTKRYMRNCKNYKVSAENETEITKEIFNDIKYLSPFGSKKTRYYFKIDDNLQWEIDIFTVGRKRYPWCKIDLEFKSKLKQLPDFPVDVLEVITLDRTPEQKKFVKRLYEGVFYIHKSESMLPLRL